MNKRWLAVFVWSLAASGGLWAQTTTSTTVAPLPYTPEEFPAWALELRRAEIVAVGAFPVMFLLSGLGYDYYHYFAVDKGPNNAYAPWPVGPGTSKWTDTAAIDQKNQTMIWASAAGALAVALIDWIWMKLDP